MTKNDLNKLIWRYRLTGITWSVTMLAFGLAFVYATLYECLNDRFDMFLSTYSVGVFLTGLPVALFLSINTFLFRRKILKRIENAN